MSHSNVDCLLDGSYWTTFQDKRKRPRVPAQLHPPARATPPTLIVDEESASAPSQMEVEVVVEEAPVQTVQKQKKKKKAVVPAAVAEVEEVESLLDGRYWQTTSNSRRALREKKRARTAVMHNNDENSASEYNSPVKRVRNSPIAIQDDDNDPVIDLLLDDYEQEEVEEEDEEIIDVIPAINLGFNLAPLKELLDREPLSFWHAMFSDKSVSDSICWSRFLAMHAEYDLNPDWSSLVFLLRVKSKVVGEQRLVVLNSLKREVEENLIALVLNCFVECCSWQKSGNAPCSMLSAS